MDIEASTCTSIIDTICIMSSPSFNNMLTSGCGENLLLSILKGYQDLLQASALLKFDTAIHLILDSLCRYAIPIMKEDEKSNSSKSSNIILNKYLKTNY